MGGIKRKEFKMNKKVIVTLTFLSLLECSAWNRGISYFHYKDDLIALPNDNRVLVDGKNLENAQKISSKIDSSINVVEKAFKSPFSKPIYITICATEKSYIKHSGGYKNSEAMTNWDRIFIAPLSFQKNNETPVLVHELTHLHISQKIGVFKMVGNIPPWFNEGFAVLISHGAGAEEYTDSAAIAWINHGKCITPNVKGNFLSPSNDSQLPWDMFYRQSSLFVSFLREINPEAFQSLLSDIENNIEFEKAFGKNYKKKVDDMFILFKEDVKYKGMAKKSS
jgi:hypothetical protein